MLTSKLPSLLRNITKSDCRLYSSAAKPSQTLSSPQALKTKQNGRSVIKSKDQIKQCTAKGNVVKKPSAKLKKQGGGGKQCGGTGGESKKPPSMSKQTDGGTCDIYDTPKANSRPFRIISYCCLPLIAAFAGYVLTRHEEMELHFVPYEYLYKRLKRFAWGDGNTTLFHGPNNFIPQEQQYEKVPNRWEVDLERRKALRVQHAKDELERRKLRHEREERNE